MRKLLVIEDEVTLTQTLTETLTYDILAIDTETDGLSRFCKMIGFSAAISSNDGFYVPLKIFDKVEQRLIDYPWSDSAKASIKVFIETLPQKKLLLHNAIFDQRAIMNDFGVWFLDSVHCDTMVLAHLVHSEEGPMGLKPLAAKYLDPDAETPKKDLADSVIANGGKVTKTNFEMYKADLAILGKYGALDTAYTFGLYEKFYPEIAKQKMEEPWLKECLPLLKISYMLNNTGIKIDRKYFQNLKQEIQSGIERLTGELLEKIGPSVAAYEVDKVMKNVTISKGSELGKLLLSLGADDLASPAIPIRFKHEILDWYKNKKGVVSIFNLASSDDKRHLLFKVLRYDSEKETATGAPSADASVISGFFCKELDITPEAYEETPWEDLLAKSEKNFKAYVLGRMLYLAAETKILSTYVEPLLEHALDDVIYTSFNQTGTTSSRYSCSKPINLQTLPRTDKRIKKGFIPKEGNVFIGNDFSALEPRVFAEVSGEDRLINAFNNNEDFYSRIAIDVFDLKGISAVETDTNFLKKVDPEKRQLSKTFSLAVVYGAGPGRISGLLKIDMEEAKELIGKYLSAYPNLHDFMRTSDQLCKSMGEIRNKTGRKRRSPLPKTIQDKYGIDPYSKKATDNLFNKYRVVEGIFDADDLFYQIKTARNNFRNFQIQGLAASILSAASIEFVERVEALGLKAKIVLSIHDELVIECPAEEAEKTAFVLQYCMEKNRVTNTMRVKMQAEPIIARNNLLEAK